MTNLITSIDPSSGQFKAAKEKVAPDTPIQMLNMLKFREQANYKDDVNVIACSGKEAYQRYSELSFPKIKAVGGSVSFKAKALTEMIAPEGEHWDDVFIVSWPTFQKFLDVVMSADYQAGTFHRTAALQDSRLIMLEATS